MITSHKLPSFQKVTVKEYTKFLASNKPAVFKVDDKTVLTVCPACFGTTAMIYFSKFKCKTCKGKGLFEIADFYESLEAERNSADG